MKTKPSFLFALLTSFLFSLLPALGHAASNSAAAQAPSMQVAQTSTEHTAFKKQGKSSFKERLMQHVAKKQVKQSHKAAKHQKSHVPGGKSQIIALILCLLLGYLGVHRFYLGYTGLGVLYIFTLGLFGIGWLIDTILLIIPRGLTPKGQDSYRD